jgi:hypothetical protein
LCAGAGGGVPAASRRAADRISGFVEPAAGATAEEGHGDDAHYGDERDQQGVLHEGSSLLAAMASRDCGEIWSLMAKSHAVSPGGAVPVKRIGMSGS